MAIGFFDSGVGGISVLEKAMEQLPKNDFIFYADSAHVPYGKKTTDEIIRYVDESVQFLRAQGADIIVLACNTATSAAANVLRAKYAFPILGMEPAVKVATQNLDSSEKNKILVTATDLTLKLEKLEHLIDRLGVNDNVEELSLQELVAFAEQGIFDTQEVKEYLYDVFSGCDLEHVCSVVLGCTHFTFYKTVIRDMMLELTGCDIPVIDGNAGTVNYLATLAVDDFDGEKPWMERIRFFESGEAVSSKKYQSFFERAFIENAGGV